MKTDKPPDLRIRTRDYALKTIKLYSQVPKTIDAQVIGRQFLLAGTSVGAHYREAQRAKSDADFISKIEGGLQELDETDYWLELLELGKFKPTETVQPLRRETNELIAIFVTIAKNAKSR